MNNTTVNSNPLKRIIEGILFQTRWFLVIFYLGLIVAQILYSFKFVESLWHLCKDYVELSETELMLAVLTLIDITMIANLIKMIIVGSYQSFVSKLENDDTERVSSGYLKVKMGSSLIGVSSIHLLQVFINSSSVTTTELISKCSIHIIFLLSTMGLAYIDYLHSVAKYSHNNHNHNHNNIESH